MLALELLSIIDQITRNVFSAWIVITDYRISNMGERTNQNHHEHDSKPPRHILIQTQCKSSTWRAGELYKLNQTCWSDALRTVGLALVLHFQTSDLMLTIGYAKQLLHWTILYIYIWILHLHANLP